MRVTNLANNNKKRIQKTHENETKFVGKERNDRS